MSAGIAGGCAQLREGMALVGREPVFQQVDIVGHALSCFRHLRPQPKCLMLLPLWRDSQKLANKNINTSCVGKLAFVHQNCNFSRIRN